MEVVLTADFWIGLLKIIGVNVVLSGDNAVVIALAAKSLPPHHQRQAVIWGSAAAVVLLVLLTAVAAELLDVPWLQIAGGLLLLWIGSQLLAVDEDGEEGTSQKHLSLMAAIRTILVADLVMSMDNVIAVAAAAKGSMVLLVLGLAISIPIVIFGATLMVRLMDRYPVLVYAGAALVGWVGGETIIEDHVLESLVHHSAVWHYTAAFAGALLVLAAGRVMAARSARAA